MRRIQKILVPLDGSPPSLAALEHAADLAEDLGASVDVLHVRAQSPSLGPSITPPESPEDRRAMDEAIATAEERLGGRLARRTETGDPMRTIVDVAGASGHDLVVMGTHGRVGRLHMVLGSVAEGVVRAAPCPVLTVRESRGAESFAERIHHGPSLADEARSQR